MREQFVGIREGGMLLNILKMLLRDAVEKGKRIFAMLHIKFSFVIKLNVEVSNEVRDKKREDIF